MSPMEKTKRTFFANPIIEKPQFFRRMNFGVVWVCRLEVGSLARASEVCPQGTGRALGPEGPGLLFLSIILYSQGSSPCSQGFLCF